MNIYNLIIEITRRCNMTCAHCLRGDAENIDISDQVLHHIGRVFRNTHIADLCIGGGEPSLAVDRLRRLKHIFIWNYIDVGNLYCVTNTKNVPDEFLELIAEWFRICTDNDISALTYSNDQFHDKPCYSELEDRWMMYSGMPIQAHNLQNPSCENIIRMGRGAAIGGRDLEICPFELDTYDDNEIQIQEGEIYINAKGDVFPNCDLSYEFMDTANYLKLGNVCDPAFNLVEAIHDFNERIDYQPITVNEFQNELEPCI